MNGNQEKMMKPTNTYDKYEIVKIPFPFSDTNQVKLRPALVISSKKHFNGKIGMSVMAMITSVKPRRDLWPSDVEIEDLPSSGLPVPSIVRFKLFTLDHRLIKGKLGTLSNVDIQSVQKMLNKVLGMD